MSRVDEHALAAAFGARGPAHLSDGPEPDAEWYEESGAAEASPTLVEGHRVLIGQLAALEQSLLQRQPASPLRGRAASRPLRRALMLSVVAALGLALLIGRAARPAFDWGGSSPAPATLSPPDVLVPPTGAPLSAAGAASAADAAAAVQPPPALPSRPAPADAIRDNGPRGQSPGIDRPVTARAAAAPPSAGPADILIRRGEAALQQSDFARAIATLNDAVRADAASPLAYRARAQAYIGKGNNDLAIVDLTHAIELVKSQPGRLTPVELLLLFRTRAVLYDLKQLDERALADVGQILAVYAQVPEIVGQLRQQLGAAGAVNFIASVYRLRAGIRLAHGDPTTARDDLTAAIELGPDSKAALHLERARIAERLGDTAAAAADCRQALAIDPSLPEARKMLARIAAR